MMPYTSLDAMHAVQQEWFEESRSHATPDTMEHFAADHRYDAPDPIGLALTKLDPGTALHRVADKFVRHSFFGLRRTA